jgi:multisubunit Na+/H+ antiporter MnhB subunit
VRHSLWHARFGTNHKMELIFSIELAVLIVALAIYVAVGRGTFAVIVGFVAYGLLLSLAWMGLAAPDVALTEAALGGGVTGTLLLRAHARLHRPNAEPESVGVFERMAALFLCLGVSACLIIAVLTLPVPAPTLAPEALAHLAMTGLGNAVTAVLMVYRALDTLLEKVVLLLALVAVWSLAADRNWGDRPVFESRKDSDGPLIFLARVLIPLGVMVGIYLFWVGADDPGGAFAGGAMISAMALLGFFAGVCAVPRVDGVWLRIALVIGIAVFLVIGLAGLAAGSGFLTYPSNFAKPVIVLIEIAMTLSIGVTLAMLVVGPGESAPP